MNQIKRGTMLRDRHAKYAIYYVVRSVFDGGPDSKYIFVNILRMRRDGVGMAIGGDKATVINKESGKLIGFDVVPDAEVPEPMRQWLGD